MQPVDVDLLDDVKVLPARPAWWDNAACRDRPEVNFFPSRGESAAPAKAVCAGCPARPACLAFARVEQIEHGVFGGLTALRAPDRSAVEFSEGEAASPAAAAGTRRAGLTPRK